MLGAVFDSVGWSLMNVHNPCILQPCAFIASEYMLMGRLARYIDSNAHLLIPPKRITVVFVASDITTFLIQVSRSIINSSRNASLTCCEGDRRRHRHYEESHPLQEG